MTIDLFEKLINSQENEFLDFKSEHHSREKEEDLIKDIISFSNTIRNENSYIIIGIQEEESEKKLVGIKDHKDDANFQQTLENKIVPKPSFLYYEYKYQNKEFGIFEIRPKRLGTPFRITSEYEEKLQKEKKGSDFLKSDEIYYRSGSKNTVADVFYKEEIEKWVAEKGERGNRLNHFVSFPKDKFIGRKDILKDIQNQFIRDKKSIVLLNGIGGIGKTTLAQVYVEQYQAYYNNILWTSVHSDLLQDLINAIQLTKFKIENLKEYDENKRTQIVLNKLNEISGNNLLILDNSNNPEEIIEYQHKLASLKNWKILLTSRANLEDINSLNVNNLSQNEAKELFLKYYKLNIEKSERGNLFKLLNHIDYHTLLIELVAKVGNKKKFSITQLYEILKENDFKDDKLQRKIQIGLHAETTNSPKIAKIKHYILSLFDFENLKEEEKQILRYFSILPSQNISLEQLKEFLQISEENENDFEDLLDELMQNGFLQENEKGYKCHSLLQSVIYEKLKPTPNNCKFLVEFFIEKLNFSINKNPLDIVKYSVFAEKITTSFYNNFQENYEIESIERIGILANNLGTILEANGNYPIAFNFYKKAREIFKQSSLDTYYYLLFPILNILIINKSLKYEDIDFEKFWGSIKKINFPIINTEMTIYKIGNLNFSKLLGIEINSDDEDFDLRKISFLEKIPETVKFVKDHFEDFNWCKLIRSFLLNRENLINEINNLINILKTELNKNPLIKGNILINEITKLFQEGKSKEALLRYEKFKNIIENLLPEKHPDFIRLDEHLFAFYFNTGNYKEAKKHIDNVVDISKKIYKKDYLKLKEAKERQEKINKKLQSN